MKITPTDLAPPYARSNNPAFGNSPRNYAPWYKVGPSKDPNIHNLSAFRTPDGIHLVRGTQEEIASYADKGARFLTVLREDGKLSRPVQDNTSMSVRTHPDLQVISHGQDLYVFYKTDNPKDNPELFTKLRLAEITRSERIAAQSRLESKLSNLNNKIDAISRKALNAKISQLNPKIFQAKRNESALFRRFLTNLPKLPMLHSFSYLGFAANETNPT